MFISDFCQFGEPNPFDLMHFIKNYSFVCWVSRILDYQEYVCKFKLVSKAMLLLGSFFQPALPARGFTIKILLFG